MHKANANTYSQVRNVIILAGGNSSRMRFPKAWLPYSKEKSILEHIADTYHKIGCAQIVVVLNNNFIKGFEKQLNGMNITLVENNAPDKGRMHSIRLGIDALDEQSMTYIHNVDAPFVRQSTLKLLQSSKPIGYARPIYRSNGGHPILVSGGVLENIKLAEDDKILRDLLKEHNCLNVSVEDKSILHNINTPEDYQLHFGLDVPDVKSYTGAVPA